MQIHSTASVDPKASLADDVEIGPYCTVGPDVRLDTGVRLISHVVVDRLTSIGERCVIHPFAVVGGAPQHLGYKGEETTLEIGADCVIREHATLNRGTVAGGGVTRVGERCFIMTAAHIAHDCQVGNDVIFANNATLGGHVRVGNGVFLGGLCAIHQNSRLGDYCFVGGCAAVAADIIPYASAIGNHAYLAGLNIIGLKRRGLNRQTIHDLRNAYKELFEGEGVFADRLERVRANYSRSDAVNAIIQFIDNGSTRALMIPAR